MNGSVQFSSLVQSLLPVQLFATPWTAVCQAALSITNSWSLLKLVSIESLMPSNHLILCRPLLLPPWSSWIHDHLMIYFCCLVIGMITWLGMENWVIQNSSNKTLIRHCSIFFFHLKLLRINLKLDNFLLVYNYIFTICPLTLPFLRNFTQTL